MKLIEANFPKTQYFQEIFPKKQIVLHHTVSNPRSAMGDAEYWLSNPDRIATYAVIQHDGTIVKCFDSKFWAHHLGLKNANNLKLNQQSIAIELDCWGGLTKNEEGKLVNAYGNVIDDKLEVIKCDWRGFKYFQSYSDIQIQVLSELLQLLMKQYGIPSNGIKDSNMNVRKDALAGKPGIYSHTNFRADKSDIYPDSRLINMLKKL